MSNVFEQLLQVVTGEMEKVEKPEPEKPPVRLTAQLQDTIRTIVKKEYTAAFEKAMANNVPTAWKPDEVMRNTITGIRTVVENELHDIMKDFNSRDTK